MLFLYIFLGLLAFALLLFLLWSVALLHTRDGHPIMKELDDAVFAHRGLHDGEKPENSLAAFEAAVNRGFGIEFDLHLTRDGALVVHHDASARRMCGVDLKINDSTLEQVRALSLPDGSKIPTFEELLSLVNGRVPLLVELKNDGNNAVPLVNASLRLLHAYNGKYIVESFDPRVLIALKKADPDVVRGQLCQNFPKTKDAPWYMRLFLASMVTNLWSFPDFIAYNVNHRSALPLRLLCAVRAKICFWTVRSEADFARCRAEHRNPIFEKLPPEFVLNEIKRS